ncbi:unnamed protein product [Orchesella dallaii]|uniref:Uncharacterized protein n=1 Tax=Orchesella dallaii TaxID=48710 RepID=A0ABP1PS74_9HEXA
MSTDNVGNDMLVILIQTLENNYRVVYIYKIVAVGVDSTAATDTLQQFWGLSKTKTNSGFLYRTHCMAHRLQLDGHKLAEPMSKHLSPVNALKLTSIGVFRLLNAHLRAVEHDLAHRWGQCFPPCHHDLRKPTQRSTRPSEGTYSCPVSSPQLINNPTVRAFEKRAVDKLPKPDPCQRKDIRPVHVATPRREGPKPAASVPSGTFLEPPASSFAQLMPKTFPPFPPTRLLKFYVIFVSIMTTQEAYPVVNEQMRHQQQLNHQNDLLLLWNSGFMNKNYAN